MESSERPKEGRLTAII